MIKSKKGIETSTLFGIIFGIIILAIVGYFVYKTYYSANNTTGNLVPSGVDIIKQGCDIACQQSAKDNWCRGREFELIDANNQKILTYASCGSWAAGNYFKKISMNPTTDAYDITKPDQKALVDKIKAALGSNAPVCSTVTC